MTYRLFVFILFLPVLAHSKSLTANLLTSDKQIKVVRSYTVDKSGIIKTPLCYRCEPSELIINSNTQLLVEGKATQIEDLLKLTLVNKSNNIRIQYYKNDMTVNYILWGESELDSRLLQ